LVCLDKNQKATGKVYLDDGEDFSYRSGNYQLMQFHVYQESKGNLFFKYEQLSGQKNSKARFFRIGVILDHEIRYSNWSSKSAVSLQLN
jgi:hypothetical protein